MASEIQPADDGEWVADGPPDKPTYGERIQFHMTSRQLTAHQLRALEPMVEGYIGLKGTELSQYTYNVCTMTQ